MTTKHWDTAYSTKAPQERSWTENGESDALDNVLQSGVEATESIIDIGGGSSTFLDSLLVRGYKRLTVLDISVTSIEEAKKRNGAMASGVSWIASDVLTWQPEETYAYWNDRAVFHFLVDPEDQKTYVEKVEQATKKQSHIVIATFSPHGPESCSGLAVQRWSAGKLAELFGSSCNVVSSSEYLHLTPWGSNQSFMRLHLQRR